MINNDYEWIIELSAIAYIIIAIVQVRLVEYKASYRFIYIARFSLYCMEHKLMAQDTNVNTLSNAFATTMHQPTVSLEPRP